MLDNVYMLAVSNTISLLGSQTKHFFAKKGKNEVRFICSAWPINCHSGMSAVGDVDSHLEGTTTITCRPF